MTSALYTSTRQDWATPPDFFAVLDREFHFTLDVAAAPDNAKCARYFTEADDGLAQDWGSARCWCNPPYAFKAAWLRKVYASARAGALVVVLIPADVDTDAWREWVLRASEVRFVSGRIAFVGTESGNPRGSAIIVYRPGDLDSPDGPRVHWVHHDGSDARPGPFSPGLFDAGTAQIDFVLREG